jgi:hypothetical protein
VDGTVKARLQHRPGPSLPNPQRWRPAMPVRPCSSGGSCAGPVIAGAAAPTVGAFGTSVAVLVEPNVICDDSYVDVGAAWPATTPTPSTPRVTAALPPMSAANTFALVCNSRFRSSELVVELFE